MGASLGSPSSGGGRRSRRHARAGFNDINVTPMVDVMLVLLIIFMVTAPMLTTGVNVDLPKTAAAPIQGNDEKLVISVNRSGEIFLAKTKVTLEELRGRLSAIANEKKDTQVLVKGDKSVDYGLVMKVLGEINSAGLTKVGLQSDPTGAGSRS